MSKQKGAAKAEAVKVDPKVVTTQKNKVRDLQKHVKRFPSDLAAAAKLQSLQSTGAIPVRKAPKEHGKIHVVKLPFRDCIDRMEMTHDAAGNPFRDAEGKAVKRYEDRLSLRVGVRELDYQGIKAKIKGKVKFMTELKEQRKARFEYTGVNMTIGDALNYVIDPNILNLAKDQGLDLTRKAREALPFDGKPGRKITVAEAILQMINYKPRRVRPQVEGEQHKPRQGKHGRKHHHKPRAEVTA